jgi:hypothetical protein
VAPHYLQLRIIRNASHNEPFAHRLTPNVIARALRAGADKCIRISALLAPPDSVAD